MNIDVYRSTLCKLSYCDNRNDAIFITDNQTDCQCYINYNNNAVFITFRGSSSIDDWKHDLDTRTENPKDNIKIHKGFFDQYMSVKDKIYKTIQQINKNINLENIHISGHSLGGALAYVCAVDIHLVTNNPNIRVLTIGSPRPGNKDFANYFNNNIRESVRYKNKNDIITKMPLTSKFKHVHPSICLKDGLQQNDTVYKMFLRRFLHTFKTSISNIGYLRDNHSVDLYVDNITKFNNNL
tara:strand:+ start:21309 stop:22025 length:717 start_codon:yes stop_codon:yes gene_type:complete